jgi:hypothetical protein
MKEEILNASLLLPKIQEASISLERVIYKSTHVDFITRQVATVLKQSVDNLELEISDIQEMIESLEVILSKDAIIPTNLSTADDNFYSFIHSSKRSCN